MGVGPSSIPPAAEHGQRKDPDDQSSHRILRIRDLPLLVLLGVAAPVAGVGLLYLLRRAGMAYTGPSVPGALPLEQLARADAQPLVRIALAWLPVGIAVGAVIAVFTRSAGGPALVVVTAVASVVFVVSSGISDSIANNEPITLHLTTPLGVSGTWVSVALLVIGAAIGEAAAAATARAPSAA